MKERVCATPMGEIRCWVNRAMGNAPWLVSALAEALSAALRVSDGR